jgi:hypothetical protein
VKLSPIIQRIRAEVPAFGNRVAGAAEFEQAAELEEITVPHAFVVHTEEDVLPSTTAGAVTQVIEEGFGVIVAVSNATDERGQASSEAMEDLKVALQTALIGWDPVAEHSACEYRGYTLLGIHRGRLWHMYLFATTYTLTQ